MGKFSKNIENQPYLCYNCGKEGVKLVGNTLLIKGSQSLLGLQSDYRIEKKYTGMPRSHCHNYYEIGLVFCGIMRVLLEDTVQEIDDAVIMLIGPNTPHYVLRKPDTPYRRLNIIFSAEYLKDYIPEWQELLEVFGPKGRLFLLDQKQKQDIYVRANAVHTETDPLRQRLLLMLLLTDLKALQKQQPEVSNTLPDHIGKTLAYLHDHYAEKITTSHLAQVTSIGRTKLIADFKQYTNQTINAYLTQYRLQMALELLKTGKTQQITAEQCGFSDAGTLIRAFHRRYGTTPYKYLHRPKQ